MEKNNLPDGKDPNNPVVIFTDGIFDCFHFGHARLLEQCKKMFDNVKLIVGVCTDEDTVINKGITIMNLYERSECVRHCKWADVVIEGCPWYPSIDYINKIGA